MTEDFRYGWDAPRIPPYEGPLPPTPPNLEVGRFPTIAEIRRLLPAKALAEFERQLAGARLDELVAVVQDWGAHAVHLHDEEYQRAARLIAEGRDGELESVRRLRLERGEL
ncbi:hypothetical protein [Crossiella cryophila]|uniref:Uncharacterized protein n=1 Tax=Crossiella cryophila TaxID=43355 RepID=A0A7W7C6X3_9PSEU|nr:hypothetical protein [Crossiella cryophila]MBB4675640.1 hypothetical protein [Crossiella cryophila]